MTEEKTEQVLMPEGEVSATQETNVPAIDTKTEEPVKKPEENTKDNSKWYIDVITGLRHGAKESREKIESLESENAALKAGQKAEVLPDAEIQRRAAELAAINRFNEQCNQIAEKGKKDLSNFDGALANLRAVGALGENSNPAFLQTIAELPDAHKLLHHLGNNPDEAARINSLPALKMAIELAKIETQITTPQHRSISKAPAPIVPVTGNGGSSGDLSDPAISMEEFARIREKQRETRAKRN